MTNFTAFTTEDLIVEVEETNILVATINRGRRGNALSRLLLEQLSTLFQAIASSSTARALVVTGDGERAFSAGADIHGLEDLDYVRGFNLATHGQGVFDELAQLPIPTIAAVNGVAFGGGLELALACDIRVCATHARFAFPEITLANIPGWGGTQRLPRTIGSGRAMHMMLTGTPIGANEALDYGLVSAVTSAETLRAEAMSMARALSVRALRAVAGIKTAIRTGHEGGHSAGQHAEAAAVAACSGTLEQVEAVTNFLHKKKTSNI